MSCCLFLSDSYRRNSSVSRRLREEIGLHHPFLQKRIVLKGGTALNLFFFDVPRLSVDIDLNYTGAADRETMLSERPNLEQVIEAVCGRLGIQIKRVPSDHAGGKWRLSYVGLVGGYGTLELDVNFMLRTHLYQ